MLEKILQAKKHVFLVFLFSGFFLWATLCIDIMIPYKDTNNYLFAFLDKINLINTPSHSPRLILLGGSSLAFGIDSREIEAVYKVRVINMSLHAGLGLKFILDSAKPFLREGDVVVLSFEYNYPFGKSMYGDDTLLFLLQNVYPQGYKLLTIQQSLALLEYVPGYLRGITTKLFYNRLRGELDECYDRRAFNKQGDMIYHWNDKLQNHKFKPKGAYKILINQDSFSYIDEFKAELNNKGVRVIFLYPSIQESTYRNQFNNIKEIENLLKMRAVSSDIANTPEEAVLPDNFFYDTPYHLNKEGTVVQTGRFIKLLDRSRVFTHKTLPSFP